MKQTATLLSLAICSGCLAETLYFGGNPVGPPNGGAGLNYNQAGQNCYRTFDDFVVPSPGWHVNEIWLYGGLPSSAATYEVDVTWQIRTGMAYLGNSRFAPGSVLQSGSAHIAATYLGTGLPSSTYGMYELRVSGLNFDLAPGVYFINIWPVTGATGASAGLVDASRPGGVGTTGSTVTLITNVPSAANICVTSALPAAYGLGGSTLGPSTVNGTIDLADFGPDEQGRTVALEVVQGGTTVDSQNVVLGPGGTYTLSTAITGTCKIAAKGSHWLRKLSADLSISPSLPVTVNLILPNGDINRDNEINIGDYAILSSAYNSAPGDPNWNPEADLNGDDAVDIGDFSILSSNYGLVGD